MAEIRVTSNSRFKNKYLLESDLPPSSQQANLPLILSTVDAVVEYLSDYVSFNDRVVHLGITWYFNPPGQGGGAASIGGMFYDIVHGIDYAYAGQNFSGADTGKYEGGVMVFLDDKGALTSGSTDMYLSQNPGPFNQIPSNKVSFFDTVLHEMLHSMGLVWMEGDSYELPVEIRNGVRYIISPAVKSLLPSGLPVSSYDGGSHYITSIDSPRAEMLFGGIMYDGRTEPSDVGSYINSAGTQRGLGLIDLAILKDLGYTVYMDQDLPVYARYGQDQETLLMNAVDEYLGLGDWWGGVRSSESITSSYNVNLMINDNVTARPGVGLTRATQVERVEFTNGPVGSIVTGSAAADLLKGLAGWDILDAGAGDDLVRGGNGRDIITGGTGSDELHGDFGWNTYTDQRDGFVDLIAIKSDQFLYNFWYDQAGNSPNGEKSDILDGLDANDQIRILGVATSDLSFQDGVNHKGAIGVGIYAKGYLEALYIGGDLNASQISAMTIGDNSEVVMSNQLWSYWQPETNPALTGL